MNHFDRWKTNTIQHQNQRWKKTTTYFKFLNGLFKCWHAVRTLFTLMYREKIVLMTQLRWFQVHNRHKCRFVTNYLNLIGLFIKIFILVYTVKNVDKQPNFEFTVIIWLREVIEQFIHHYLCHKQYIWWTLLFLLFIQIHTSHFTSAAAIGIGIQWRSSIQSSVLEEITGWTPVTRQKCFFKVNQKTAWKLVYLRLSPMVSKVHKCLRNPLNFQVIHQLQHHDHKYSQRHKSLCECVRVRVSAFLKS